MLVLMLGLVMILMFEARDPSHYQWFFAEGDRGAAKSVSQGRSSEDHRVDTRVQPELEAEEIPGTFVPPAPITHVQPAPSRYFPGVDPRYLDSIRDNKPLGVSEWDAWLHFFHVLQRTDEATLREAATGPVGFVQLFEQSKEYRGELVTAQGIIRRAHPAKTPENQYGLTDYYQTWLWPDDHPNDPMAVWCLDLPDGFPIGMEMAEPSEVTGFYFKLWAYKAADGTVRRAPMLLSRTIHRRRKPAVAQSPSSHRASSPLMFAGAAALAVSAAAYVYYRTRRHASTHALTHVESLPDEDVLRAADTGPDVGAVLQQLAESEETPNQSPSPDRNSGPR
jgi:hypothetical protein